MLASPEISYAAIYWCALYNCVLLLVIYLMVSQCMEYVPNLAELIRDEDSDDYEA